MTLRQRSAGLALFALLGFLTAVLTADLQGVKAQQGSVPAQTMQRVGPFTPEPPLADQPPPVRPPVVIPQPLPPAGGIICPGEVPVQPPLVAPPVVKVQEGIFCPVDPPTPVVSIRVRAPASGAPGQEITYHIVIENCSEADAHHVVVRDPVPANARFVRSSPEPQVVGPELVWQLGTMAACTCKEITLVLMPTGPDDVKNCARVMFEHGQCVLTKMARAELSVQKTGPTTAHLNDTLNYRITVTNTSDLEARDVLLTDSLPEGLEHDGGKNQRTWALGNLAPGQSVSKDYQVIARQVGQMCNRAVARAANADAREARHCVTVSEARIDLIKTGPERRFLNLPATYQITVVNPGSAPVENVVITDAIPAQTTFVNATDGGQLIEGQVRWSVGVLAPGARRTVQVTIKGKVAGEVVNKATATAERGLTAQAEARTNFEGATGLTIDVDDKYDPIEVGKGNVYTITIINQGQEAATNVSITAVAPPEMEVRDAKGPTKAKTVGQTVTFEPLPMLQPGGTETYEVHVQAMKPGDVRFKVELRADELKAGPVKREESTRIYSDIPQGRAVPPEPGKPMRP